MASAPRRGGVNISFATTRSHQLARGAPACFLSGISGWFSLSLGAWAPKNLARRKMRIWRGEKWLRRRDGGALTSASPRPDRTSWLGGLRRAFSPALRGGSLYAWARGRRRIWRGEKWLRRRDGGALTSASPRPDRTSWLGGLRRAFSPALRGGSLYPLARGRRRIWRGEKWLRRRDGGALTSASPRPDRTSWLGGLRRAFSPAFRSRSLYPLARGRRRIWRGEKWLRRRDGGALTSASPRPDRT